MATTPSPKLAGMPEFTDLSDSLASLLNQLEASHEAELSAETQLNAIREGNAKRLAKLSKKQQDEYIEGEKKAFLLRLDEEKKLHKQRLKEINKELAVNADKSDEEFERITHRSRKQAEKERAEVKKRIEEDTKRRLDADKQVEKTRKAVDKERNELQKKQLDEQSKILFDGTKTFSERLDALKGMGKDAEGEFSAKRMMLNLGQSLKDALSDFAKQLDNSIDEIGKYKSSIDTRLQGLRADTKLGSYWDKISQDITGIAGISPLIKQADLVNKVNEMISQGIAFNVEQRAGLAVLKDKIATTFDAANGTLLRLVRIQQQDTTAGRLGMESALTEFLNSMYQTTEYMQGIANSIKGNLEEAMSLMTGEAAVGFEYQVQKWMGSMYSVGMSDSAVQNLGKTLGDLVAGKLDAVTQGGTGNLVIMAANEAGMSIGDILKDGLDADETNKLLSHVIDYLSKIYAEAGDSRVVQQQIANVYGMSASDLKAAVTLAQRSNDVLTSNGKEKNGEAFDYNDALARLTDMANSMWSRTSIGELMANTFDNIKYSMAAGIANDPVLYSIYKVAGMLDKTVGGITLPDISVMGNSVALHTTIADLMRVTALSGSMLEGMAAIMQSGGNGGITGGGIINALKVNNGIAKGQNYEYVSKGVSGLNNAPRPMDQNALLNRPKARFGGATGSNVTIEGEESLYYDSSEDMSARYGGTEAESSESGAMIANSGSDDIVNKTMTDANDSNKATMAEATASNTDKTLNDIHADMEDVTAEVVNIYNLLSSLVNGGGLGVYLKGQAPELELRIKQPDIVPGIESPTVL